MYISSYINYVLLLYWRYTNQIITWNSITEFNRKSFERVCIFLAVPTNHELDTYLGDQRVMTHYLYLSAFR
jgi:hypothetical protein